MRHLNNNKLFIAIFISSTFMLTGCETVQQAALLLQPPTPVAEQNTIDMSNRFEEPVTEVQTAVESAIELSEKYAELSDTLAKERQTSQNLTIENRELKGRIAVLEPQLEQTQKELAQANDLLMETTIDFNNWKNNVIGFRDEMRDADKVQLETMLKILKVLGGEVKESEGNIEVAAQIETTNIQQN